jgi:hypothetical protein
MSSESACGRAGAGPELMKFDRFAEEKWLHRFTKMAKNHYREMGLVSISFVAFTDTKGRLVIDM